MEVANKSDAAWNSIGLFFMNDQYEENCSIDSIFLLLVRHDTTQYKTV